MAENNNKSPEEASNLFHNIMKASVRDNSKPVTGFVTTIDGIEVQFKKEFIGDVKYQMMITETGVTYDIIKTKEGKYELAPFSKEQQLNDAIHNAIVSYEIIKENDI